MSDDKFSKVGLALAALLVAVGTFSAGFYNGQGLSAESQSAQVLSATRATFSPTEVMRLRQALNSITGLALPKTEMPKTTLYQSVPASQPSVQSSVEEQLLADSEWCKFLKGLDEQMEEMYRTLRFQLYELEQKFNRVCLAEDGRTEYDTPDCSNLKEQINSLRKLIETLIPAMDTVHATYLKDCKGVTMVNTNYLN
jgi:hypothetical protein